MTEKVPRSLTDKERALWAHVTRALTPLPRGPSVEPVTPEKARAVPAAASPPRAPAPGTGAAAVPELDRRLKQRLARGLIAIDARIDLHGLTQAEAFAQLTRFLRRARRGGARMVLVITGKGGSSDGDFQGRGVLRRQVPLWLSSGELREVVVAFGPAAAGHGGAGALYVRLRRPDR
jgi:DNA-nicking Smr family endonuclease